MRKITNKEIREYLGHNGRECRVRIRRNGEVLRYGSPDPIDRSGDCWTYMGEREFYESILADLAEKKGDNHGKNKL